MSTCASLPMPLRDAACDAGRCAVDIAEDYIPIDGCPIRVCILGGDVGDDRAYITVAEAAEVAEALLTLIERLEQRS